MPRPNTNRFEPVGDGSTRLITRHGDVFLIDDADMATVRKYCWRRLARTDYAQTTVIADGRHQTLYLHRLLCPTTEERPEVDHKEGRRDNRRSNLRACTRAENLRNARTRKDSKTGVKGVRRLPHGKYSAVVMVNQVKSHLGVFDDIASAAAAATAFREIHHGEFARHS